MDTVPAPRILHMEDAKTKQLLPHDGTAPLLKGGIWTLATGVLSALAIKLFFGGIGQHGPHTNMGWLLLIVTMMCLPCGSMLFLLGAAKWLRNRRLGRQ